LFSLYHFLPQDVKRRCNKYCDLVNSTSFRCLYQLVGCRSYRSFLQVLVGWLLVLNWFLRMWIFHTS